ncbi:hypothetical protein HQ487_01895 [Candidatus Uhrbacteria bacterium]|nr:hypothetical protein [Candidatus Uhrbacteria bacterium]
MVLRARLVGGYDQQGYLLDEKGKDIVKPNGDYVIEDNPSFRAFIKDQETRGLLGELNELFANEAIPDDVKASMRMYLKSQDQTLLDRIEQAALADGKDAGFVAEFVSTLSQLEQKKRLVTFSEGFFKIHDQSNSFDDALVYLRVYETQTEDDRARVEQFARYVFAKRRTEFIASYAQALDQEVVDYTAVLERLKVLSSSVSKQDKSAVIPLARQAYARELAEFQKDVQMRLTRRAKPEEVYAFIDAQPVRPSIDQYDYVETITKMKEYARRILGESEKMDRLKRTNDIRGLFPTAASSVVLEQLEAFPKETSEDQAIAVQMLEEYRQFAAANRPQDFDEAFGQELAQTLESRRQGKFVKAELGRNKEAFSYTQRRFTEAIYPLEQVLRDDPRTRDAMEEVLGNTKTGGSGERARYVLRLKALSEQRPLTDTERSYLESVELLSLHNPYLVAVASSAPGVTKEFLNHHFDRKTKLTVDSLKDGDYVPALIIGSGPSGMIAFGELVRQRPDLAEQSILVDEGETIGGPFAIPRGPAWELNSANRRGEGGASLPDRSSIAEIDTVRAYGNPTTRWYPGERAQDKDVRAGSINATVDYLLTPDDLSTARYPTNEELQLTLSLQAALTVNKMLLGTRLMKCEPAPEDGQPGTKLVTLEIREANGETKVLKIRTDFIPTSSGLGQPSYGFSLPGSRAERILEATANTNDFPKLSTTLEAFRALADRRREKKSSIGKTLVIWGRGNSTDTLIEFVGNIFNGENPRVRDVTKIYVIADGDLSARPRYAQITDLKPRNGRGNLVEFISARVADAGFSDATQESIQVYDEQGQVIRTNDGEPIVADAGIAATGFQPTAGEVFAPMLQDGQKFRSKNETELGIESVSLPTNMDVAVADRLKSDPTVLFLGTASRPQFNVTKLAQLPTPARDALLRNGAENAVAIGFRGPDTQAAMNITLNSLDIVLPNTVESKRDQIALDGEIQLGAEVAIRRVVAPDALGIPDDVEAEAIFLSSLLAYEVGNTIEVLNSSSGRSRRFTGDVNFEVTYVEEAGRFQLKFTGGDQSTISQPLLNEISRVVQQKDFQRYAISALRKRRRASKLSLDVAFKKGFLDPQRTFVQES